MPKRVISEKELTACYGLMFSEYPDIVNIRQLQAMLGISRHAAYDLLGEGEIGCIKLLPAAGPPPAPRRGFAGSGITRVIPLLRGVEGVVSPV